MATQKIKHNSQIIISELNGKNYRPYRTSHPCKSKRFCDLYCREICEADRPDTLPCDAIYDKLERVGLWTDSNVNFKEVK